MDVEEAIICWLYYKKNKNTRKRRYWVHPVLQNRLASSLSAILYPKLRTNECKFFNYFRMSMKSFDELLECIQDELASPNAIRYSISPKEKLIVTLRYLASGCSMTELHYSYKIGKSTISGIIHQVCEVIWKKLKDTVMPIPDREKWIEISHGFERSAKFPHCIGALDGKHIRLRKPQHSGSLYFNYKHFFSLVLLALCDSDYRFIWVDIGAYGKDIDSGIFRDSVLYKKLTEKSLDIPKPTPLTEKNDMAVPYVIVADEAFGLMENLMRPYGGKQLNYEKKIFNYRLTLARRYVECTFGIASNKWRILHRPIDVNENCAIQIIKAITVLHNYVRMRDGCRPEDASLEGNLLNLTNDHHGRSTLSADNTRIKFTNYFVNEGKIPYQDQMI